MALSENRKAQNANTMGQQIKAAREAEGYTQKALADAIGLDYYTMISQMELGYVTVPVTLWVPLANTLKLDRSDFILRCILAYQPDLYDALFGHRGRSEVSRFLTQFNKGQLDQSNGETE